MDNKILKDIPGYSRYMANNAGELFSKNYKRTGKFRKLKPALTGGYYKTLLKNDEGKYITVSVHSAVAFAFHGVRPDGYDTDHINGIRTDNRPENLEYVTHSENCKRSFKLGLQLPQKGSSNPMAKLTEKDVFEIRSYVKNFKGFCYGRAALAKKYGVSEAGIKDVISKRRGSWKHVSV